MSGLEDRLLLEALPEEIHGEGLFLVMEDFEFEYNGEIIKVPAGFTTDLCSIPTLARPFFSISGRVSKPALLHDFLIGTDDPRAAAVFDTALRVAGIKPATRWTMVQAVRFWQWFRRMRARLCRP